MQRLIDSQIQTLSWKSQTGKAIGGNPATSYGIDQSFSPVARFFVNGPAYADGESYISRPILPNTGNLELDFDLMLDNNAPNNAQAYEFDSRVSIAGYNYNFSSQILNTTGELQISKADGSWVGTGLFPGILKPIPYTFKYVYKFDIVGLKYSFVSLSVDYAVYSVMSNLQNIVPTKLGWADGVVIQVQQDINSKGLGYSHQINNMNLIWS